MNLVTSINQAMEQAMSKDNKVVLFGEDIGFGGVFRCSMNLQEKFGKDRVFNTPLCEQGIAGFAIGMASVGWKPIAEIQFADYILPAFDQICNEAAKYRYRSGGLFDVGGLTFRAPCAGVGHGGLYHSQSVEAFFAHCPGLKVVIPSNPSDAKGLLLSCIEEQDPCLFFEPKIMYRASTGMVEQDYFTIPLGKGKILKEGTDLTIVAWGTQIGVAKDAIAMAEQDTGCSVELIDLRTIMPWDVELIEASVNKTGRLIVTHEEQQTCSMSSEICSTITERCFYRLEAPPKRLAGYDVPPISLSHEKYYLPNKLKLFAAIREAVTVNA